MNAVLVANGELAANERLRELWREADLRLAADGGAGNARRELGLPPQVVIGDLDSLDQETRGWLKENGAEFFEYPPAKDQTDLELALDLASERGAAQVTIVGALGGRIDHFIANVLLLTRTRQVIIADAVSEMWTAAERATIDGTPGDTVSLMPLDERVEGIITQNLAYPLRNETLARGSTRGISNRLTAPRAEVRWTSGLLLVVHLFDGNTVSG